MPAFGPRDRSVTAGLAAQTVLGHNKGRLFLLIQNLHATANVWVRFATTTDTPVDAVASSAGCIKLSAGSSVAWDAGFVPSTPFSVIADLAGVPLTVIEG